MNTKTRGQQKSELRYKEEQGRYAGRNLREIIRLLEYCGWLLLIIAMILGATFIANVLQTLIKR